MLAIYVFMGVTVIISSFLNILKHHGGKLVIRNFSVSVLINLFNDHLNDIFVEVLSERQDLLNLVSGDRTSAILVEHLKGSLKLVIAEQILLVHRCDDEL